MSRTKLMKVMLAEAEERGIEIEKVFLQIV